MPYKDYINKKRLYDTVDPTAPYPKDFGEIVQHVINFTFSVDKGAVKDKVSDAAWRKRLELPYDNTLIKDNKDGTFSLPDFNESQIEVDTIKIKDRIKEHKDYFGDISESNMKFKDERAYNKMNKDKQYLNDLRRMYNNGDTISVNEYAASKINSDITPLNVLQNFSLHKNKDKVIYEDVYDFNNYEDYIPGKAFKIKGIVK